MSAQTENLIDPNGMNNSTGSFLFDPLSSGHINMHVIQKNLFLTCSRALFVCGRETNMKVKQESK